MKVILPIYLIFVFVQPLVKHLKKHFKKCKKQKLPGLKLLVKLENQFRSRCTARLFTV